MATETLRCDDDDDIPDDVLEEEEEPPCDGDTHWFNDGDDPLEWM